MLMEISSMPIINCVMNHFKALYRFFFPSYSTTLERAVGLSHSLLDVGCGASSPIQGFSRRLYRVGVDIYEPSLQQSKRRHIHDKYVKMNILEIDKRFKNNSFDCVIALDVVEHLSKQDAKKLIKMMESIARKKVILFTPNGFIRQHEYDNNSWQVHKSGWSPTELRHLGYTVYGYGGWKFLKGDHAHVKFRPRRLWIFISDVLQVVMKFIPSQSFHLFCVKEKQKTIS